MKFDLLETGNGGTDQPESGDVFNNLFGVIDTENRAHLKNTNTNAVETDYADMALTEIVDTLKNPNLNLSEDIIADIKNRLKELFEKIYSGDMGTASVESEQLNGPGNASFVHIMKFLEELESLITFNQNSSNIKQQLEKILDQVRTKLNEQVKAFIEKKIKGQNTSNNDTKIVPQDQKNNLASNKQALNKENNSNGTELKKSNLTLPKNFAKVETQKNFHPKLCL